MDACERQQLAGMIATAIVTAFNSIAPEKNIPEFPLGNVPISVAAEIYQKDVTYIRAGIIAGWLPIGRAVRDGKVVTDINDMDSRKGRITYQISPRKLWEDTGFIWKGEKTAKELRESKR